MKWIKIEDGCKLPKHKKPTKENPLGYSIEVLVFTDRFTNVVPEVSEQVTPR